MRRISRFKTAFTVRAEGLCTIRWARQATEEESEVLKLSKGQNKNIDGREKTEEEQREAGREWLIKRFAPQWAGVFMCVCEAWRGHRNQHIGGLNQVST